LYKVSGADKNIGTVVALAKYLLLGESCTGINWTEVAHFEYLFFAKRLFGNVTNEELKTGLTMIENYYLRDYRGLPMSCKKNKKDGSFPIGVL
jgi:hypothetical protein